MPKRKELTEKQKQLRAEYQKEMWKANKKLERLEKLANNPTYEGVLNYAYRVAARDIKNLGIGDSEKVRFRMPSNTNKLEAAIKRAKKFNAMPTSGKREIDVIYRANAKNFNKAFGTNFTWQELRTFMKQSDWENLDKKYGYKLMKKAIKSYVDKNKAEASVKAANEQHKNVKPDEVADEIVKSLAKDGLKFDMLTSGTGEFVNPDDNPFID